MPAPAPIKSSISQLVIVHAEAPLAANCPLNVEGCFVHIQCGLGHTRIEDGGPGTSHHSVYPSCSMTNKRCHYSQYVGA